ncbi:MAG: hypothetical protein OEV44_02055 [Spirochaetota bacterium]|nr:hypothetical protein [Spirochaetota bacterium]
MSKYKIDGAKFDSMEDLKETLWELYQSKMTPEEFDKYVKEKAEAIE